MKRFPLLSLLAALVLLGLFTGSLPAQQPEAKPQQGDPLLKLLEKDYTPPEPILPPDIKKNAEYRDLDLEPVGSIEFVENEAYVIHPDEPGVARKAQKSKQVYKNDSLVTDQSSRLVVLLKDKSQLTLSASSKVVLDNVSFDEATQTRDTTVSMPAGKARFIVSKTVTANQNNFKVDTPLAVIGVRGSDFVLGILPEGDVPGQQRSLLDRLGIVSTAHAAPVNTALVVLAGANTSLSLRPSVGPPIVLNSFQITTAFRGVPPMPPMPVSPNLTPGVMNKVGAPVSVMSMPAVFE